jgi:hypothetical protein
MVMTWPSSVEQRPRIGVRRRWAEAVNAHLDDNLAEGSTPEMLVGISGPLERINLIDDRMDLMLIEEVIHPFKGAGGCNSDATNRSLAEDHAHQIEVGSLPLQEADLPSAFILARFSSLLEVAMTFAPNAKAI